MVKSVCQLNHSTFIHLFSQGTWGSEKLTTSTPNPVPTTNLFQFKLKSLFHSPSHSWFSQIIKFRIGWRTLAWKCETAHDTFLWMLPCNIPKLQMTPVDKHSQGKGEKRRPELLDCLLHLCASSYTNQETFSAFEPLWNEFPCNSSWRHCNWYKLCWCLFKSVKKLLIMLDPTSIVSIRLVLPWVKQCVFVSWVP